MLFWIFVILAIVGVAVIAGTIIFEDSNGNKVQRFLCRNDETLFETGFVVAVISGIISLILMCFVLAVQIRADGLRLENEQRYNALMYKAQSESIRDEFGIVNKEYIDEVQSWNEDLAKYRSYSNNFWIDIFYPKRAYEGLEIIDLQSIKMKD